MRKFPSSSVRTQISSTQNPSRAAVRRSPLKKAEEEESPEQAENTRKNVQADIDITVDDDE